MLFGEFKTQLGLMGYATATDDPVAVSVTNRALAELYSRVCFSKTACFIARGSVLSGYYRQIDCINGERKTFAVKGNAYYMRVVGEGQFMITQGDSYNVIPIEGGPVPSVYKGFLNGEAEFSFWGSSSFTIYDFTLFHSILSPHLEDIPEGGDRKSYDMYQIFDDFMSFITPPTDSAARPIEGAVCSEGSIELAADYIGEVRLCYRRRPRVIGGLDTETVDVPEEYIIPLLYLTAYLGLVDSDEALANHYRARFEKMAENMRKETYRTLDTGYTDVNGWA